MQFDDQQNIDPTEQDNPFDFDSSRQAAGERASDARDRAGNTFPGGRQAAGAGRQGLDPRQQQQQGLGQAQQGMGNLDEALQQQQGQQGLGGQGDMLGAAGQDTSTRPTSASTDPNDLYGNDPDHPYGGGKDAVTNDGNTQIEPNPRGLFDI
jgi:hypothetical protein